MERNAAQSLVELRDQWRAFGLDKRRGHLDESAKAITEAQDASTKSRKKLAENTRAFRKLGDAEKLRQFGSLLKCYQEEVDNLTRRSKSAENAYLSVYRGLANIADPTIAIQAAISAEASNKGKNHTKLEIQNQKLQNELEEFRREFQDIKNQEVTIKRLQEQVKQYEMKLDDMTATKVAEKEQQLQQEYNRLIQEMKNRENQLLAQLHTEQEELKRVNDSNISIESELLELRKHYEDDSLRKQTELEMVNDENERLRGRVAMVEQALNQLRNQDSEEKQGSSSQQSALEALLASRNEEIMQLKASLQEFQDLFDTERRTYKDELANLIAQLQEERQKCNKLRIELERAPSPQELKDLQSQLEIFQRLDYAIDTSDVEGSVEKLLREKNRGLETENLKLKLKDEDSQQQIQKLQQELEQSTLTITDNQARIKELEEEITQSLSSKGKEDLSELLATRSMQTSDSMVQILCNQRDRYKNALVEEEKNKRALEGQVEELRAEKRDLHEDNVKLYEKIKFLQNYRNISQTRGDGNVDLELGTSPSVGSVEQKYRSAYEESVNPFVLFHRKEKLDRFQQLNTAERVTLKTGQFFLSNKFSRTFIFFYALLLHVLVMGVLYYLANTRTPQIQED